MATRILAMSGRAAAFATRQPRVAIGASLLSCIVLTELLAALAIQASL